MSLLSRQAHDALVADAGLEPPAPATCALGWSLSDFWLDDAPPGDGGRRTFLYGFSVQVRESFPRAPATEQERRAACICVLRRIVQREMPLPDPPWSPYYLHGLLDEVRMARQLGAIELCAEYCQLLRHVGAALATERLGPSTPALHRLACALYDLLAAHSSDAEIWRALCDPECAHAFAPVLRRIGSPDAVPRILASFAQMPEASQEAAVGALGRLADGRALPLLRTLAAGTETTLAACAQEALSRVLARSGDDAVRLLRSSEADPGEPERTLVRTSETDPRSELLRSIGRFNQQN